MNKLPILAFVGRSTKRNKPIAYKKNITLTNILSISISICSQKKKTIKNGTKMSSIYISPSYKKLLYHYLITNLAKSLASFCPKSSQSEFLPVALSNSKVPHYQSE
ncbi:hypothetical protein ACMAZD_11760 [Vibrio sp. nBUS_14]|uniref:hypothetical protein n=1 Tax=Vibrio sp. nBUS_14 TaxID=3395321 RepID=UPI003EB7CEBB